MPDPMTDRSRRRQLGTTGIAGQQDVVAERAKFGIDVH